MTNPTLDQRAAALALTEHGVGWAVADLALEAKRNREPHWAERIAKPFGYERRWPQALARAAEFCELPEVKALRPRENLRVTHWASLAAYWGREGVEIDQLLEIAEDAIAESVSVKAIERRLQECFGFAGIEIPARRLAVYSEQVFSWAERRGPNDALYPRLIACAAELRDLAKEMQK